MLIKKSLIIIFFVSLSSIGYGQKLYNKIAVEMCDCIEKKQLNFKDSATVYEGFKNCMPTILYYARELKEINIDILDSNDVAAATIEVMKILTKECTPFVNAMATHLMRPAPKLAPITDPTACNALREGTFIDLGDTTQVILKKPKEQVITFTGTGQTSRSKIEWTGDCSYKLIFIESSNPDKKQMMDKNEVTLVEITGNEGNMFTYKATWRNIVYEGTMRKKE